jgi:hypothetical protein
MGCILVPPHTQHQEVRRWPSSATDISRTIHVTRYGVSFARNEVPFARNEVSFARKEVSFARKEISFARDR